MKEYKGPKVYGSFTGVPTHHFFTVDEHMQPVMRDDQGRILVYIDRQKAINDAHAKYGDDKTLITIGMGDEKWKLFQSMERYVLVE